MLKYQKFICAAGEKRNYSTYFLGIYLVVLVVGCVLPLNTGIFRIRTNFNSEIFRWVAHVDVSDIVINLFLYVPVGYLLTATKRRTKNIFLRVISSVMIGVGLSATVEFIQYFIVDRTSSSVDVLLNFIGTCMGVVLAIMTLNIVCREPRSN